MTAPDLVDRLSEHKTIGKAPREELAWVAAHGRVQQLVADEVLTSRTGRVAGLHIVLRGHLSISVDRGGGRRKVLEWREGDVTGLLPYSRLIAPPGDVVAEVATEVVTVDRDDLPAMIRECHDLTAILVHVMLDRARQFTSSDLHDEKMVSLGKLAAGLAHELNNPASAVVRSAKSLAGHIVAAEAAARALGAAGLADAQVSAVEAVREICLAAPIESVRSPLEQADREDALADWLKGHGTDAGCAAPLAETAVTIETLDRLAGVLQGPLLETALRWVAAGCATRRLALEIEMAASRIYELVQAVKGFTQMDRATVPGPVDIGQGLSNTLAVLAAKARAKAVGVTVDVGVDLPRVQGFGGELNQVWANLIDNALDAVAESGRVEVTAAREGGSVVVRIVDDGAGIPADIRERIFDPFFTTKEVGAGMGLGLDIVRRLVQRHDGEIQVESRPGRTEFRVSLPVADPGSRGGPA